MADDDLKQLILRVLVDVAPEADPGTLDPHVSFRDQIDMDSVDFLNFVLALERELGIAVPEADYPRLSGLTGCLDALPMLIESARNATAAQ